MEIWTNSLLAVFLVSALSFVGVCALVFQQKLLQKVVKVLVALAAGTLIGDVFLHIIPELYETGLEIDFGLLIIAGILVFLVLEQVLHWHHQHGEEDDHHHQYALGMNNLLADGMHNFIDGMLIAASFAVDPAIGVATTIAVILHEIPQEIGDFGVLLHAGFKPIQALVFNFLSALAAVLGAVFTLIVNQNVENIIPILLAFAGGGFIYIAVSDLLPELRRDVSRRRAVVQLAAILLGILIMWLVRLVAE
jgi:zinc and cadmium transporter